MGDLVEDSNEEETKQEAPSEPSSEEIDLDSIDLGDLVEDSNEEETKQEAPSESLVDNINLDDIDIGDLQDFDNNQENDSKSSMESIDPNHIINEVGLDELKDVSIDAGKNIEEDLSEEIDLDDLKEEYDFENGIEIDSLEDKSQGENLLKGDSRDYVNTSDDDYITDMNEEDDDLIRSVEEEVLNEKLDNIVGEHITHKPDELKKSTNTDSSSWQIQSYKLDEKENLEIMLTNGMGFTVDCKSISDEGKVITLGNFECRIVCKDDIYINWNNLSTKIPRRKTA